jgi:hypothetical protein
VPDTYGNRDQSGVRGQAPVRNVSGRTSRGARVLAGIAGLILVAALLVAALQPRGTTSGAPIVLPTPAVSVIAGGTPAPASAAPSAPNPAAPPAASVVGVLTAPTNSASGPGDGRIPTPAAAQPSTPALIPNPDFAALRPGQSRAIATLESVPQFNSVGTRVAWAGELYTWPDLEPEASFAGEALGWGRVGSAEALLVQLPQGGYRVLATDGTEAMANFDLKPLYGTTSATWSPDRDRLWVQSPDWPSSSVSLYDWTAGGRQIATVPDAHNGAARLTASEDERWIAASWSRCGPSGCFYWISAGRAADISLDGLRSHGSGTLRALHIDAQGRVSAVVDRGHGAVFLAGYARAGALTTLARSVRDWWPLDGGSYVILDGGNLERLDPVAGQVETLRLPGGVDGARVLSVSPDGAWIAAWSSAGGGKVRFLESQGGAPGIDTATTFGPDVRVMWARDGSFALLADGPPLTQTIVRIAPGQPSKSDRRRRIVPRQLA